MFCILYASLCTKVPVLGTQSMTGSAQPNGLIASEDVMQSWALYVSKWIEAYKKHGVDIWAVHNILSPLSPLPSALPPLPLLFHVFFTILFHSFVNEADTSE